MDERDERFFEDIARGIDSWVEAALGGLQDPASSSYEKKAALASVAATVRTPEQRDAFETVVRETLTGLAHSIMVTLDGGSAYSDRHGSPRLLHGNGQPFVAGLHEWLFDHLSRTGRLT
jgi:hypothetical protein